MNDSFMTNVFVRFLPESIACACIYLAARQLQIALPDRPSWYSIFNVREDDIQEICLTILRLYARQRPNVEELGAKVMEAKRIQMENKKKSKGMTSDYGTPNSTSRANSPKNLSHDDCLIIAINIHNHLISQLGRDDRPIIALDNHDYMIKQLGHDDPLIIALDNHDHMIKQLGHDDRLNIALNIHDNLITQFEHDDRLIIALNIHDHLITQFEHDDHLNIALIFMII
ncbi:CCNL [Mytilus coruscus]|uniref:CCNL n=1 Tax=Mytilus coruscus TaxID=42192 RepID=A0A6J8CUS0_MYTCO|nr:CCNL [Mytilus coruscus]